MLLMIVPIIGLMFGDLPAADVGAGPEPSAIPLSWELDFTFLDPRRIEVQLPGERHPDVYWYMVYTVRNNTGRSQRFFPTFELVTDELRVLNTDIGIHPLVFDAIRERHKATHKYLVSPTKAIGDLRVGDDNAIESVAIWRATDTDVNHFRIYIAGLSGETAIVRNPARTRSKITEAALAAEKSDNREATDEPRRFTLRKTLELRYDLLGSADGRAKAAPERKSIRWIMR